MPNFQRGKCAGISGILSLDNGATLRVKVTRWELNLSGEPRARKGRGNVWVTLRHTLATGNVLFEGVEVNEATAPAPNAWRQINGRVAFSVFAGKSISYPVTILSNGYRFDEKKNDWPRVLAAAQIIGDPTCTGWTTTPSLPSVSKTNQEQYGDGTVKTYDQKGLLTSATRTTDIWTDIQDTDSAETQLLVSTVVAALPPIIVAGQTLKLRTAVFSRNAVDGGQIVETWGLTDSKDDFENQGTSQPDPVGLFDNASIYKVQNNATPAPPTAPLGQLISQDIKKLNDNKWLAIYGYGSLTNKQKLEFADSPIDDDQSDLSDNDVQTLQTGSSIPPAAPSPRVADLQLLRIQSLHAGGVPVVWTHRFSFGRNTGKDTIEVEGTRTTQDVSDLGETATVRKVTNSSTPPSTPTAPVGQLIETTTEPLTVPNGAYSGYWVHTFSYGPTTKLQEREFSGNSTADASVIGDSEIIPLVNGSSTPPAQPVTTIADLQLIRRKSTRFQGTPEKWQHVFEFGHNTTQDQIELDGTETIDDPSDLGESASITQVTDSETPPATPPAPTGVLLEIETHPITVSNGSYSGRWRHIFRFGPTTRLQTISFEGAVEDDPSDLTDRDVQTVLSASSAAPATPPPNIADLPLVRRLSQRIQGTPEKWKHRFEFGRNTALNTLENDGTDTRNDIDQIEGQARIRKVTASSTPPGAPGAPLGILVATETKPITSANGSYTGRWAHTFSYGAFTRKQKLEFGETGFDVSKINDSDEIPLVTSSSAAPTTPTPADHDLQFVKRVSRKIQSTPEKWRHVFFFARNTPQNELELKGTNARIDPDHFMETGRIALLNDSDTPPTTPAAPVVGQLIDTEVQPLTVQSGSFTGLWLITYFFGANKRKQEIEFEQTVASADPFDVYKRRTASIVAWTDTAPALATSVQMANLANPDYAGVTAKLLTPAWALQIIETSGEDAKIIPGGRTVQRDSLRGIPVGALGLNTIPAASFGNTAALVKVQILQRAAGGNGRRLFLPTYIDRALGSFTFRRCFITSTPWSFYFPGLLKTVNIDTFLGYPAHQVRYMGAKTLFTLAIATAHLAVIDYAFSTDDAMHVNDGDLFIGDGGDNESPTLTESGFFPPTDFDRTALLRWPDTGNFQTFLTAPLPPP